MLPSEPKIFHGRDSELSDILHLFSQGTPRIAILGAGGMGKTSLARAVIHHTEIIERYNQHRFFVACDSAATQVELAALIGAHVGLKPGKDLTHPVIQYFSSSSDCFLILDNLETLWEPAESRGKIEEFLSLLAGVDHLALVIKMRGAERPAKVAWTHPFLPALKPLEQDAARQTFIDIADNTHDPKEVDKVLSLTDNVPLAISLIHTQMKPSWYPELGLNGLYLDPAWTWFQLDEHAVLQNIEEKLPLKSDLHNEYNGNAKQVMQFMSRNKYVVPDLQYECKATVLYKQAHAEQDCAALEKYWLFLTY
ncbi:P-loop containing nucleoside triphosphate hydrolase protein [Mycena leptocephala]|nr:P-loop containing nucleoside triphosphate hydrolase protein [Mycena leptocephala]